jgi:hypothetical protein
LVGFSFWLAKDILFLEIGKYEERRKGKYIYPNKKIQIVDTSETLAPAFGQFYILQPKTVLLAATQN